MRFAFSRLIALRLVVSALMAFSLVSCNQALPSSLIVLKGADKLKHFYTGGIYRIFYQLEQKFPADDQIQIVMKELETKGWQPLTQEYLHPGISTSLITGWTFYEDPPKKPEWMIYEWSGNWKDHSNNVVTYAFQYRDPINKYRKNTVIMKPASSTLLVHAVYMPEKVAMNMRESINKKKAKQ